VKKMPSFSSKSSRPPFLWSFGLVSLCSVPSVARMAWLVAGLGGVEVSLLLWVTVLGVAAGEGSPGNVEPMCSLRCWTRKPALSKPRGLSTGGAGLRGVSPLSRVGAGWFAARWDPAAVSAVLLH